MKKIVFALAIVLLTGACTDASQTEEARETTVATETSSDAVVEATEEPTSFTAIALTCTLNGAYITTDYQGITPDSGMELLVLNVTTVNEQSTALTMYDTDYQIQWGGEGESDYSTPITYRDEWMDAPTYKKSVNLDGVTGMYETQQTIEDSFTGDLVYQVPEGTRSFILLFQEYFEDESVGDLYSLTFTVTDE